MDSNLALLRRSLCYNQWLAQRIALFGTGEQSRAVGSHCQRFWGNSNVVLGALLLRHGLLGSAAAEPRT